MTHDWITEYSILSYLPLLAETALILAAFISAMIILALLISTTFHFAAPPLFTKWLNVTLFS